MGSSDIVGLPVFFIDKDIQNNGFGEKWKCDFSNLTHLIVRILLVLPSSKKLSLFLLHLRQVGLWSLQLNTGCLWGNLMVLPERMLINTGGDSVPYLDPHCCQEKSNLLSWPTAIMEFLCLCGGSTVPRSDLEWRAMKWWWTGLNVCYRTELAGQQWLGRWVLVLERGLILNPGGNSPTLAAYLRHDSPTVRPSQAAPIWGQCSSLPSNSCTVHLTAWVQWTSASLSLHLHLQGHILSFLSSLLCCALKVINKQSNSLAGVCGVLLRGQSGAVIKAQTIILLLLS